MEHLYVPTTTLNFNNILSTGSISPAAVYDARQFGYKQFEVVKPNPFKNVLLLYDRYPEFVLEDADRDNHHLVLRVRTDRLPGNLTKQHSQQADVSVYIYEETIYFDPSSADLFFPSEEVLQVVLSKSEPSLTTKLVELYRPFMRVYRSGELDAFEWSSEVLEDLHDGKFEADQRCCESDIRINRLKGFISGYIIGAYKSIDPKVARFRSNVRAIRNDVSARLNDPAGKYSESIRKDLDFSCSTLENFYAEAEVGTQRFDPDKGDRIRIEDGTILAIRDRHETSGDSTQSLLQLVNKYSLTSEFYGQLDEERLRVAVEGVKAIRALIGSRWESSDDQVYLNALLNNIQSGSEFNFYESSNLALQSFAGFILKGDDLEKLEAFLTAHGIGDFRIAFALWGAMFGYSKIPKTFYNLPFQQGNKTYASRMHNYIHSVVHRIPINKLRRPAQHPEAPPVDEALPKRATRFPLFDRLQQKIPGAEPWMPKLNQLLQENGGLNKDFINRLKKTNMSDLGPKPGKGTKKKAVIRFFEDYLESQPSVSNSQSELPLDSPNTILFWNDTQVWEALSIVVPTEKHKKVRKNLEWFQKEWQDPDSKYYGWMNPTAKATIAKKPLIERTNEDAIEAFYRLKQNIEYLSKEQLENARQLLRDRYNGPRAN